MGGSAEPDGYRGFGRIHLEMGMPLGGDGSLALFVADSANTSIPELSQHEFTFDVDADADLEFRATLSWIDPPSTALGAVQLINDLDLAVVAPNGTIHTMWASGVADSVNVNERVIVDVSDVESGNWTVRVSAERLTTEFQRYSLVVNGAIVPLAGDGADGGISQAFTSPPSISPSVSPSSSSLSSDASSPPDTPSSSAAPSSAPTGTDERAGSSAGSISSMPLSLVAVLFGAVVSTIAAATCAV